MPVIKIWCLPKNIPEERLKTLRNAIVASVESIAELGLAGKNAVTVLFPKDLMEYGLGEEIIAEVVIFIKPERTDEVRARLAENIGQILHGYFPCAMIECFIHPHERSAGFWKIDPRPNPEQTLSDPPSASDQPHSISDYLERIRSDVAKIDERLMSAPADLTGNSEQSLYEILNKMKALLDDAKKAWPN